MGRGVGWIVDEAQRAMLLARFPPRYGQVIAHHVTLWGHRKNAEVPSAADIVLVGYAENGRDLECYVASVDGKIDRPDGSIYHVTWSLDPETGVRAKDSNALLKKGGWTALEEPVPLVTRPDFL